MILDESLVLIEEKKTNNIFGREKGYIDKLIQGPVVDFIYKKDDDTWAMSWYDFNLHLKNIPNLQSFLQKFKIWEYFYSGPNTGKKTEVIFPKFEVIGFLSIKSSECGISITKIANGWFVDRNIETSLPFIRFRIVPSADAISPAKLVATEIPYDAVDRNLILRRYFTVLSEEEKTWVWKGSRYSELLGNISWEEFKEIYDLK